MPKSVAVGTRIALLQEVAGDVMRQRCEPYTLALSHRSAHEPVRRGVPAQRPRRGRLALLPLRKVLLSAVSAEETPSLLDRFIGTTPPSTPHSRGCSSFGFGLHEPGRHALPITAEASQIPCKELLHVHKASDCSRFSHASQYAKGDVAFSTLYAIVTSELGPFRSSILGPL